LFETLNSEHPRNGEDLLGVLEYYEAVLGRNGLIERDGEFRCLKLGLILDILKIVNIPDDLRSELITAVISAWRMNPLTKSLAQSENELKKILCSIEVVRREIRGAIKHPSSMKIMQFDAPVMFALPLLPTDLNTEEVPRIYNLLRQVMNCFAARIDMRNWPQSRCTSDSWQEKTD
jgi:hypothetical protein